MAKANTTVFFSKDVIPEMELARLQKNEKILNLAKGNFEYTLSHEEGEPVYQRCKEVHALLKAFTPSEWDSEENARVSLCLAYLKLGFGGCWHESFYRVARACLCDLYPAITTIQKRIELWQSIVDFGEVCKAARDASAFSVPGRSDEDPRTTKKGSPVPFEIEQRILEMERKEQQRQKAKTRPKKPPQ